MKRLYSIKLLIAIMGLAVTQSNAQLSGLYTINSAAPASASNFSNFTSFASAVNLIGVAGPVTVNVVPNSGPYDEQVTFSVVPGASASNNIVINGNGNTLSWAASSSNAAWTLLLNGTDYLVVNNLTINGVGSYAYVLMLVGGADYNGFNSVTVSSPVNGTSSAYMTVAFSGLSTSYSSSGTSGNYNIFTGCTIKYGYYAVSCYGPTSLPYSTDNQFINCNIRDFYYMGIHCRYAQNFTVSGCTFDRPTHPNVTNAYAMYIYYNRGAFINGNRISNLFGASPGSTSGCYGIYVYYNTGTGPGAVQNRVQNNVISDIGNNAYIYPIYMYYGNGFIEHNTVVLDDLTNNNGSTFYGIYGTPSGTNYPLTVRNNIVYMHLAGTGLKYGIYYSNSSGITSDYNDVFLNNAGTGAQHYGFLNGNQTTLANLQVAGSDPNSLSLDPMFVAPMFGNYMPTNNVMNDVGLPVGISNDINSLARNTLPDMGAIEFYNSSCAGIPSGSSVLTPTAIQCAANNAPVVVANIYTVSGLSFQWQSSTTSSVGPFTPIAGATTQAIMTPTTPNSTWYNVVITCTNGNQSSQTSAGQVLVAGTVTNSVPYYEGFEGVANTNRLPNCSWSSNNPAVTCRTYTSPLNQGRIANTGSKYASFYYLPAGTSYFYTNGIYLNAGVTYSTGLWFKTDYYGYATWTDLSIMLGTSQTTTGLVTLASSNGPAISSVYKLFSNTFTVATSGLYYVAIRGISGSQSGANHLMWDDLFITAPCDLNPTVVNISASNTVICSGKPITLSASGASSYNWSNGANTAAITVMPNSNTTYVVSGTNLLTGCSVSASKLIQVNPSPIVGIFAPATSVCKGSSVTLIGFGANAYNWSTGSSNANIVVSPTVTTTYTVNGVNSYGCIGSAIQAITVNNPPFINIAATNVQLCAGESVTLTALGASSYIWNSISSTIIGSIAVVSPPASVGYTVTGTDAKGCSNTSNINLLVLKCVGVEEIGSTTGSVKLYPNPSKSDFTLEFPSDAVKTIELIDLTGRVVINHTSGKQKANFNINNLAAGVYYVKIQSGNTVEVVKLMKQ